MQGISLNDNTHCGLMASTLLWTKHYVLEVSSPGVAPWSIVVDKWNLNLKKGQGTSKMCSLYRDVVLMRFFSIYFTITGSKNIVQFTEDFVI